MTSIFLNERIDALKPPEPEGRYATDLVHICDHFNVKLERRWDFVDTPTVAHLVRGSGESVIYYRPGLDRIRERFAVAHCLAHYGMEHEDVPPETAECFRSDVVDNVEWMTNRIALEILVPRKKLSKVLREHCSASETEAVAKLFDVSPQAIKQRIGDLRRGTMIRCSNYETTH